MEFILILIKAFLISTKYTYNQHYAQYIKLNGVFQSETSLDIKA